MGEFAGQPRFELGVAVLETAGLPLTDCPKVCDYSQTLSDTQNKNIHTNIVFPFLVAGNGVEPYISWLMRPE